MRFLRYILCALLFIGTSFAETININWLDGDTTYAQTTCDIGGDLILPTPPTKRGYTFKGWQGNRYTRLEYIEGTGTQYIDTGVVGDWKQVSKILVDMKKPLVTGESDWFGAGDGGGLNYAGTFTNLDAYVLQLGNYVTYAKIDNNIRHTHVFDSTNREIMFDGATIQATSLNWAVNDSGTFTIFKRNKQQRAPVAMTLYKMQIWNNSSVLIRNFVPVRHNIDGAVGMYDTVTKQFFGNSGTGEFIAGPVAENQNLYE